MICQMEANCQIAANPQIAAKAASTPSLSRSEGEGWGGVPLNLKLNLLLLTPHSSPLTPSSWLPFQTTRLRTG
ncbi:hypothetical protein D3C81_1911500 [compost metagenome]